MDTQQLNIFITVAESRSLSSAAEKLFLSKQNLKRKVDALEDSLGVVLLLRSKSGCRLSPAGELFYHYAKEAVEIETNMIHQLQEMSQEKQSIVILNPPHPRLLLENAFVEFKKQYPDIEQRLIFKERGSDVDASSHGITSETATTLAKLRAGSADVADISHLIGTPFPDDMEFLRVCPLSYFCIMAPNHKLSNLKSISLKQLSGLEVHLAPGKMPGFLSELYQFCPNCSLHPVHYVSAQDIFTVCGSGGIWISKAAFVKHLQPLVAIPLDVPSNAEAGILYMKKHSPAVDRFIEVVKSTSAEASFLSL